MKKFVDSFKTIQFTEKNAPWILWAACILAFGLLIPQLGFFQDDWNYVFNHYLFGQQGISDFLSYDARPFAAWVYDLGFSILGYEPLFWHVAALILRWLTATVLWMVFQSLWPKDRWQNLTAALIFTLYPFFTLQPLAVAYSLHWTGYLLYALSIYLMLAALKKGFWVYTPLALLAQALHLFTLEFYTGIDLLRPVFLWVALSASDLSTREKLKTVLRKWAPYLAVFVLYFVWRVFIYQAAAEGRNTPLLLTALLNDPLAAILTTINNAIPDVVLILFSSWYKLIQPEYFDFKQSANLYIFIIILVSFGIFYFFLQQSRFSEEGNHNASKSYLVVGVIAVILSLLPVYAADYVIHIKNEPWNSRFSLGALLGAALIITGLVDYAIKASKTRWIILAAVFAFLVGWHLHYTNDFRWAWSKQVDFYRQLYLRAPEIEGNTAILSEGEFFLYMGDYPTAYGINLIYTPRGDGFEGSRTTKYWFFPLAEFYSTVNEYLGGKAFSANRAGVSFKGDLGGSFVVSYEPEIGRCLWVMRPEYANLKSLSDSLRLLSPISHVERIKEAPQSEDSFLLKYLYTKPKQDWCYYYEKADLAYQYEEWNRVVQLWENADSSGLHPNSGFEYLPFIEGYAHTGDWNTAKKMTASSQKTMQGIEPVLCNIWSRLETDSPASAEREAALVSVKEDLHCSQE